MTRPTVRRRPAVAAAVVALGVTLLVVGVDMLRHDPSRRLPRSFGSVAPLMTTSPGFFAATAPSPGPAASSTAPGDEQVGGSGVPLRVRVGRLHVNAPVVPVRSAHGAIEVPTRPSTLGWWTGGAVPGSLVGSTVIVGHVDSAASGPGALFHLDEIHAGDMVTVVITGGQSVRYSVTGLHVVHKSTGLSSADLDTAGPDRLALITCGGPFDRATRSYRDNIVVTAARLPSG